MLKSLDDITPEICNEIVNLAGLFFTPTEIALQLEIDQEYFKEAMLNEEGPLYRSFQKGRLQSEVLLRASIIKLAKSGSSPAQTMAMDLLMKSKAKMLDQ